MTCWAEPPGDPQNSLSKPGSANLHHSMLATPAMQQYQQDLLIDPSALIGDSAYMHPFSAGQFGGDFRSQTDDLGQMPTYASHLQSSNMIHEQDKMEMEMGLELDGGRKCLGTVGAYGTYSGHSFQGADLIDTGETSGKYSPGGAKGDLGKAGSKGRYRTAKQQTLNKQAQQRYRCVLCKK